METDLSKINWNPDTCSCRLELLRFDQGTDGITRVYSAAGKLREEVPHPGRMPGTRIRARIAESCAEHAGYTGVVQAQRRTRPCGCRRVELHKGDMKEGGLLGTITERICPEHE